MNEIYSATKGTVRIHENVIATIVRRMACSVEGVSKISGSSFVDNIAEIHDRSIVVEMGPSSVSVEVSVNLYYGVSLPQVAAAVQTAIADEITRLTGLKVGCVNIVVREIEDAEEPQEEEE